MDHPRTRGVYPTWPEVEGCKSGSSPHTRGLPAALPFGGGVSRIIPAHAGFTITRGGARLTPRDHPRTRGVYVWVCVPVWGCVGSSPHTRGLLGVSREAGIIVRIIPAHAGFTIGRMITSNISTDHPRTRGVYSPRQPWCARFCGSSPHTRGLLGINVSQLNINRIIPAHAGFTLGDPWNPNGPGVYHPPVSFTADLVPARRSCGSAAVEPRWTTTPWAA